MNTSSGHLRAVKIGGREFLPAASRGKAIEPEQGSAVDDDMTHLHHPVESDHLRLIDFIAAQQFDIVAKVAQEPVELPEGFGSAIKSAGNDVVEKAAGLENVERKRVIGFLCLSAKLDL